ncbi:YhgE/Pip domain-containing protein [Bacillus sp. 31A1R]|uniref:YhgE/Pip domain-containing protein n=2 Tax=Robertmurraya mangrovi TaxID=3098077 RepID=A0ABU5J2K2_9BACI|nr:YhgE/Pip domain-containing protein [Bacillus sp. 31A1R]
MTVILPSFLVTADTTNLVEAQKVEGKVTSKDEVVYATLKANGGIDKIHVVNTLDVRLAGEILDYGDYSTIKNLSDMSALELDGQTVRMDIPEGKFYYQGNLKEDSELPWEFAVSYSLDGREVDPSALAGKTGHVEINIETSANKNMDTVFYENYLLQVSLLLPNSYSNIEAPGGMVANAGKDKQITFTALPGQEEKFSVEADVDDFEFRGIEIAAVPSTLPIDTSEMDSMTEDMSTLSDAIGELNNGVADLKDGVIKLNNGVLSLKDGSAQYKSGINQLDGASAEIVSASRTIGDALVTINDSLSSNSTEMELTGLNELPKGLTQLANGLTETANGLSALRENYSLAYRALDEAIKEIPTAQLTEEQISDLYKSGANSTVLDKLVESYAAAQKVKGTFLSTKPAFDAVEPSLKQASEAVKIMSGTLTSISKDLSESLEGMDMSGLGELQKGIAELASNYSKFHSVLVSYTKGVSQLSSSYNQLHSGIVGLSDGTGELDKGVGELRNGTNELYEETKDLPEQMQQEINEMIQEYDKSDFEPVSFVSSKNEKVSSVQFVIKTESIQIEEKETKKEKPEKEKGFWQLFLDLFK